VVIITAHGTVDRAVEAMRGAPRLHRQTVLDGPADRVASSVCSTRLLLEQNVRLQEQLEQRHSFANIIGKSKPMQEVFELIRLVADSDASVLVHGESGTGKEMVAAAVHFNSRRRAKPYVRVSCPSLPESLIESELFGYERGAFTGASERRIGRFEAASGGTLFLDEIGDLPLALQVKLLRSSERKIERLGSTARSTSTSGSSPPRAAAREEIRPGRFRGDLSSASTRWPSPAAAAAAQGTSAAGQSFLREFAERQRRSRASPTGDGALRSTTGPATCASCARDRARGAVLQGRPDHGRRPARPLRARGRRSRAAACRRCARLLGPVARRRGRGHPLPGATRSRRADAAELLGISRTDPLGEDPAPRHRADE
jgi:hypothetical protein